MQSWRRRSYLYTAGLLVAALVLFLTGARAPAPVSLRVGAAGTATVPDLSGHWSGAWEDTIYGVSGAIEMDITVDGDQWSGTGSIDVTSISPGLGTLTGTASGTVSGGVLTFDFTCFNLGIGSGTLSNGVGSGSGAVGAPLSFGDFTYEGVATQTAIDGTFDFTSPSGGAGNVHLDRSVANRAVSWSDVKSRYAP